MEDTQHFKNNCDVSVPQFYSGRSIFITGATGFLGKVLVEKLLRSCPDIKNIYLLIRPKRGQDVTDRLSELLRSTLFDTIRRENPTKLNNVIPISGDMTFENLGISDNEQSMLCKTVSIVFHSAATVSFNEKLKLAVNINMIGTRRIIELCHRMMLLEAIVHVSTAYCNWNRQELNEVVYSTSYQPNNIISLVNWLPEDKLDELTPSLLDNHANTYTFTKELSEQMLLQEAANLPLAIVRPSVVGPCCVEPTPGWVDNHNGITGILSALSKGFLRTLMCDGNSSIDIIPVDFVISMMIAVAWQTAKTSSSDMKVFNCVSGKNNPIKCRAFIDKGLQFTIKHPLEDILWYPTITLHMNKKLHALHFYLVPYTAAYLLELFALSSGNPLMKLQKMLHNKIETAKPFLTRQWNFNDENARDLLTHMSQEDNRNFQFDVCVIDWEKYMENYMLGIREFLFKQSSKSLPSARKRMSRLYYLHQASKMLLVVSAWGLLWPTFKKRSKL